MPRGPKTGKHLKPRDSYPNSVRRYRLLRRLTLQALADQIGVTPQAIHRLEIKGFGLDTIPLLNMAEYLGCTLRELLAPTNEPISE